MRISRRFAATALVAGLIGVAAGLGPAGSAAASPGAHRIGDYDGKTFATASTLNTLVTMRAPSSGEDQVWRFTQDTTGAYQIVSALTAGCLAVDTTSPAFKPAIVQQPCRSTQYERWQLVRTSDVHVAFRSVGVQGRCIGVDTTGSTAAGLYGFPCDFGSPSQQFRLL